MKNVFLTGGSGLLGARLMRALCRAGEPVVALDRSGGFAEGVSPEGAELRTVRGDLLEPQTYAAALEGVETVFHLAAATGNADKQTHFRVNAEGTENLLRLARSAGVQRFVFVSSIAVKFRDKTRYYYAQSKESAEDAVRRSGLSFVIVRPTIIAGPGAGALSALERLATLPVMPVPGTGKARVQPIWVGDLADSIVELGESGVEGQTIEIGGPQTITMEELLQEIRRVRRGDRGRVVHLPLRPLLAMLGMFEAVGARHLPVTPGQLASFRFDGVADGSAFCEGRRNRLKTVTQMLELSFAA